MSSGAIYRKCEEPEDIGNKASMASRKAGGFLLQHCRCGSNETSISILFIVNAVSFVLWTIIVAVLFSKYSDMTRELEQLQTNQTSLGENGSNMQKEVKQLHSSQSAYGSRLDNGLQKMENDQNGLKSNMSERLADTQRERDKIWAETFRLQDALYKMNSSACRVCPAGWVLNRGQCYYFQEQEKQWSFAKQSCKDQGGYLVIINDNDEQTFLNSKKKSITYWIGLSDRQTENKFFWVDGSSPTYTHWNPREPNNADRGEDCVEMVTTGWWNDRECGGTTNGWICEKSWKC
ncbi:CD209 antigen-like protein C [Tiliqua scincoides]|uniref:CD209 antigen-like protein C n=1 Tax=Tiliqua scincoides TaxID=71010 RepID=UPI003462BB7A